MTWQDYLDANASRFLDELIAFLRIPSISALPEHADDVRRAGEWVAARLRQAGIENVALMETGGHPVVYGDWLRAGEGPTVLLYGHFDTQPVDPVDLWSHPPFEPTVDGDRIYARGATDDKGNLLAPVLALEALLQTQGALSVNVKVFFEGQEEIGSPQLTEFVTAHGELLSCDVILSADGGQFSEMEPALQMGLRGVCGLQIDVRGANRDLHSGSFGGAVQNPIHALVRLLDAMRGPDGKILVGGFYRDVASLSEEERAGIADVPYDEQEYMQDLGVSELFGEPGYTTRERTWIRPTLEVNGIWGGFQGEGTKTVLPNEAHAKITCRLVPDQDPTHIVESIKAHVWANTPPGVEVTVTSRDMGAKPYVIPLEHPANQLACEVLTELYGTEPYLMRMGGTIPVASLLLEELGAHMVVFSFGLPDERTHAPNEFWRLSSFRRSQTAYAMLLNKIGEKGL